MDVRPSNGYVKRHSRWERPNGGSIQITERDLDYLELLFEIGPLRANFLHALVSPNVSQVVTTRRLNKLFRAPHAFVDRPKQQRESYTANYSFIVYDISAKGEQLLADRGRISDEERVWRGGLSRGRYVSFWHEVMLGEIVAGLRLGLSRNSAPRFISWREILRKAPSATRASKSPFAMGAELRNPIFPPGVSAKVVPDSIFGLEYMQDGKRSYRFFAVEADRATEPVHRTTLHGSSFHKKIELYREVVRQEAHLSHLGVPNLFVLTVTTSERHKDSLINFVKATYGQSKLFLFKHLTGNGESTIPPSPDILRVPWRRAGYEDFDIFRP